MKKFLMLMLVLLFFPNMSLATEQMNMKEFTNEVKNYSDEIFPEFSKEDWINEVISRKDGIRWTRHISTNC